MLVVGAAALGGALGFAGSAYADSTPIQGTWNFQGGQVVIQANPDGTLIGVDVVPTTFLNCTHPVGQVIWNLSGSGLSYTGTHLWLHDNCQPFAGGAATWVIDNTNPAQYVMTFCTAYPGTGPPDPTATPGHPVHTTLCYSLTRALSPAQTQAVSLPANVTPPTISGTPKAGSTLTCSTGTWTNSPTGYNYQWSRGGTPIVGATNSTYTVATSDEGLTLTCIVRAANAGGLSPPATSAGILVPVPFVRGCPAATGRLSGAMLGLVRLGMTRPAARKKYVHSSNRRSKYKDFFCLTPNGVRVGYASPKLLGSVARSRRKRVQGRVVWASTANAFYTVHTVRPGATLTAAATQLKLGAPFHIGLNDWYLAPNGRSTAVLKVRHGIVEEIGIADKRLTRTRRAERTLMSSFY